MSYELADGSVKEYCYGLMRIEFRGEITAGRVIFGDSEGGGESENFQSCSISDRRNLRVFKPWHFATHKIRPHSGKRFLGPVVALISRHTGSAAE
jgi:hypothetical protein